MPTRWISLGVFSKSAEDKPLTFGQSFSRCDRPSNQSCVLDDQTDDNVRSCRTYNISSGDWNNDTWYYFHMHRLENVSVVELEFKSVNNNISSDETVPPCENVSLSIQPFDTVRFQPEEEMLQRIHDRSSDVRLDTFRISGTIVPLFIFQTGRVCVTPFVVGVAT